MVIQITENRKINGKWFLAPQQYELIRQYIVPTSTIYGQCQDKCQNAGMFVYDILVNGITYTIPSDIAALTTSEIPSTNMKGSIERWEEKRCHDITLKKGEHTDVVKQADDFLGFDITQHLNNIQVDQIKLRELREIKRYRKENG